MRIALDARECGDPWTGMGRYAQSVIGELAERARHEYVVLLPPNGPVPPALQRPGLELVRSTSRPYSPSEHLALPCELARHRVDGLHALTYALPLTTSLPRSLTLFDVVPAMFPENYSLRARVYWRTVLPRTVARARFVATLAPSEADLIMGHFDIERARIRVLPAGVGPPFTATDADHGDARRLAALGVRRPYLFTHGNQRPHKNLPAAVAAYAALRHRHPSLQLVLSGGARAEPGGSAILRIGRVDDQTVASLYRQAAVYVLPSLHEGGALTVLEAMACGTPCVLARCGPLADLYAGAAVFSEPTPAALANAVHALLVDGARASRQRRIGQELARTHSWQRAAAALEETLERSLFA